MAGGLIGAVLGPTLAARSRDIFSVPFAGAYIALAGVALLAEGFGGSGFSIMQATLVYLFAPAEMRSRMLGVLSVCIGFGPNGFVNIGRMADWLGGPWAVVVRGCEGVARRGRGVPRVRT